MDHVISIDESEIWATQNARLEALKGRNLSTLDDQRWLRDGGLSKIMDRDLYEATKEGDVMKFMDALEKVSQSRELALSLIFDLVTPSGDSLLHVAAISGKEDVMKLILIHFPHLLTRKNSSEDTPLHVAVRDGRFNATKMLIRKDVEIMYWENKDSKSPLYLAVENQKPELKGADWDILELLLEEYARDGAYVAKIQGMSPVLAALEKEKSDILREVVNRLPKLLHVRGKDGGTPLLSAASSVGEGLAAWFLLERCPELALQTDKNGSYPIHIACQEGSSFFTIINLIDRTWPDLAEIKDNKGQNILHVAAKAGNDDTIRAISKLCHEAVFKKLVNSKDVDGNTPLHLASTQDHWLVLVDIINQLIGHTWPDLAEIKNNEGQNILHVAAKAGNNSMVQYILEKWGEKLVNTKDVYGNTPLHLASMRNHCGAMRSLTKDKRSDVKLLNNEGLSALDVAMEPQSFSSKDPAVPGRKILIKAGVKRSKVRDVRSPRERSAGASKPSRAEWIKDEINTQLLVATLVASVTFTAAFTLPGGYNASSDPHPGMATMLHRGVFQVFVICDTLAMYNSILAVVVFLGGRVSNIRVAESAYKIAAPLLLWAFISMAVAFVAAITVAVSKLTWLMALVLGIAVLYTVILLGHYSPLIGPRGKVYR